MTEAASEARLAGAMGRFKAFFDELRGAFMERGDVLAQIALALLAREHVLLAGPPGTAKSQLASAVLGRIVCEQSGSASFYARQITESTVQTDLIGPIDFKNLTETGRTSHFTDEGLLGNVHAFLDEVFDGRDMLLRSALNLLQEREVKQGGTIAKGRIECALMTSNRYISEVLEQSRETLLAFVDRIAFIGFVPRGFADPANLGAVLRRNVGGTGKPRFDALLTIQDLDVLQAACDDVHVAPELCDRLAQLLGAFDAELASATRSDPTFIPTRYISTRTAVRCGGLLRAACMFDRIFRETKRGPEAKLSDFELLRLHLLLSGPTPEQVKTLLAREVDPIEKRQLSILRTERELFDACLSKLPALTQVTPRPRAPAARPAAAVGAEARASAEEPARVDPLGALEQRLAAAHERSDTHGMIEIARAAAELAREGAEQAPRARAVMERATRAVSVVGMRVMLDAAGSSEGHAVAEARRIVELAGSLSDGTASMHPIAKWMQSHALDLIDDAALYATAAESSMLEAAAVGAGALGDAPMKDTEVRLSLLGELAQLREGLLAAAASSGSKQTQDAAWNQAIDNMETMLVAWWSRAFVAGMKEGAAKGNLDDVLRALEPELLRLSRVDERLSAIAKRSTGIKRRVAGGRIAELVRAALENGKADDRNALIGQTRSLLGILSRFDLRGAVETRSWLKWSAECLLAADARATKDVRGLLDEEPNRDGYRLLRDRSQRVAITCTLSEVALLLAFDAPPAARETDLKLAALLEDLPPKTRERVMRADLERIGLAVGYLERWFLKLKHAKLRDAAASGLFSLLWNESALARFSLELRLVEELMDAAREPVQAMRARIDALHHATLARGMALLEEASVGAKAEA